MTATGHAIIGTVIAAKIGNPALAIPLAIISHLAADAFPHWDTGTNRKKKSRTIFFYESVLDVLLSFILPFLITYYFFPQTNLVYLYVMVIAAQGFDWLSAPYVFLRWEFPPFSWPYYLQTWFDNRLDKPWGVIGQAAVLLALIVFAKVI